MERRETTLALEEAEALPYIHTYIHACLHVNLFRGARDDTTLALEEAEALPEIISDSPPSISFRGPSVAREGVARFAWVYMYMHPCTIMTVGTHPSTHPSIHPSVRACIQTYIRTYIPQETASRCFAFAVSVSRTVSTRRTDL